MATEGQHVDTVQEISTDLGLHSLSPRQIADQAILNYEEDMLRRAPFAEHLAEFIDGWHGEYSLVIALHGPWGSGKTSVKNLTVEALKAIEGRHNIVVNFNPWRWSGQDQITTAFFQEMGSTIGESDPSGIDAKELENKWNRYSARFSLISFLGRAAKFGGAMLGGADLGITSLIGAGFENAGKTAAELTDAAAKDYASTAEHVPTLEKLKHDLAADLGRLTEPILIVMDDIDRLAPDELKQLFGLVKANADLPNLVFLLLFQRNTVSEGLAKALNISSGDQYLKKIIQIEFDIPATDARQMRTVLLDGILNSLKENEKQELDIKDLNKFLDICSPIFFQTLRDIYRFSITLDFHISLLRKTGALEINPIDLVILETLRLHEPELYQGIATNKTALTINRSDVEIAQDQFPDELVQNWQKVQGILDLASEGRKDIIQYIFKLLFPVVMSMLENEDEVHYPDPNQAYIQRRSCDRDNFDRYFFFVVPQEQITEAEIRSLIDIRANPESLEQQIAQARTGLRLIPLLQEVVRRDIPHENCDNLITALFTTGDKPVPAEETLYRLRLLSILRDLISQLLRKVPTEEARLAMFEASLNKSVGLLVPIAIIQQQLSFWEDDPEIDIFGLPILETLKTLIVHKIKALADSHLLIKQTNLPMYLRRWKDWGNADNPRKWVTNLLAEPFGSIVYLQAFTTTVKNTVSIDKSIASFCDLQYLQEQLFSIPKDDINAEKQNAIDALVNALGRGGFDNETQIQKSIGQFEKKT